SSGPPSLGTALAPRRRPVGWADWRPRGFRLPTPRSPEPRSPRQAWLGGPERRDWPRRFSYSASAAGVFLPMLSKRLASGHPSTEPILGDWGAEARQSRRGTQVWRSAGAAVAPVGDRSYEPPPAET
ncbi:hypothetical protein CABS03_15248, partial [Colletotrichum abscissum]